MVTTISRHTTQARHARAQGRAPSSRAHAPFAACGRKSRRLAPLPSPTSSHAILDKPSVASSGTDAGGVTEFIDWRNQWYPVAPLESLDMDRPQPVVILGKNLVVWSPDAGNTWSVLEDMCPHRKVALSEGRVENGNIMCAYHAWTFNSEGRCTCIPQILDSERRAAVCRSPAAAATSFPCQKGGGLLWVWMTAGEDAHARAAGTPLPWTDADVPAGALATPWYMRDMPFSWETLAENLLDSDHVSSAHHSIIGNRYAPLVTPLAKVDMQGPHSFTVASDSVQEAAQLPRHEGQKPKLPPTWVDYEYRKVPTASRLMMKDAAQNKTQMEIVFMVSPVTEHSCRIMTRSLLPGLPAPVRGLLSLKPVWWDHLEASPIPDGDGVFLRSHSPLVKQGHVDPLHDYFTPAAGDLAINAMWKFLDRFNRGGVAAGADFYPGPEPRTPPGADELRRQSLDRYVNHTKHCPACRGALANVRLLKAVCGVVAVAALAAGLGVLAMGMSPTSVQVKAFAAAAVLLGALFKVWERLEARFVFVDYRHADYN